MPDVAQELAMLEDRIKQLEERQSQQFRIGTVTQLDPFRYWVKVQFCDNDALESHWLQVLTRKTYLDKDYWLPDIGEQVFCIFLPFSHETGFVINAMYSEKDLVPVVDPTKRHVKFADGGWGEYDRVTGTLKICVRNIELQALEQFTIRSPSVDILPECTCVPVPTIPTPLEECEDAG